MVGKCTLLYYAKTENPFYPYFSSYIKIIPSLNKVSAAFPQCSLEYKM